MNKRFEARTTHATKIRAEDSAAVWRVYDKSTKKWYPKCPPTNQFDAELIANSLNNGHLQP